MARKSAMRARLEGRLADLQLEAGRLAMLIRELEYLLAAEDARDSDEGEVATGKA